MSISTHLNGTSTSTLQFTKLVALTSISIGRFSSSSLSPLPSPATIPSPSPSTPAFYKPKHHPSPFPSAIFSLASTTHTLVKNSPPESDSEDDDPKAAAQTRTRARGDASNPSQGRGRGGSRSSKAAKGLVTDYTEPQNLFALAVNSPPSRAFAGSCGHGPDGAEMAVRWRVGYAAGANHYFFEEARRADGQNQNHNHNHGHNHGRDGNGNGNGNLQTMGSGADLLGEDDGQYGQNYKRLSSRRAWL
ncbi:hypothetical protein GGR51DRAFT_159126 [Nemania sp. FL0031]|nr:hypothetical protein GGR51DRAFT_159126 [Nemania sp. FL0031]